MNQPFSINPEMLLPMDMFCGSFPISIDLAYARHDNALFGARIYHENARLWLHKDLAKIVILASSLTHREHQLHLVLHDGLRTTDAQQAMIKTKRVQDNPHWLEEPRLLSPPGAGAHPRGMAIDVSIAGLDMGTAFDDLSAAAHRDYHHSESIIKNQKILSNAMTKAADILGYPLLPLPQEWWDFRMPVDIYETYAPLSDSDLPDYMKMMTQPADIPESIVERVGAITKNIQSMMSSM